MFMKKNKLLSLVLLFAISFSTLHAFAINYLDTDNCSASEYVEEIANESSHHGHESGDVCSVHYLFHTAFIIPIYEGFISDIDTEDKPLSIQSSYTYNKLENFLKPPIL
jgi:hypothetical protein